MKKTVILLISLFVVLIMSGAVCGESASPSDTGVTTNVIFGKMNNVGMEYEFQPFLTQYTGTNDWGRYTFVAGADNLEKGNYSLMQQTSSGLQLVQSYKIEPLGSATPEYVLLTLEVNKEDLPVPLQFTGNSGITGISSPVPTPAALVTTSPAPSLTTVTTTAVPVPTKSPVSPFILLTALGIAGIICVASRRN
jgi:hypothetical protein